jgi:hypothetical protein
MSHQSRSLKRKRSYSGDTIRATVRAFRAVEEFMNDHPDLDLDPMVIAIATSGGASERQIYRWINSDNSERSRVNRLRHRGTKPKHPIEFKWLAVGFVLHRRSLLLVVRREHVIEFYGNFLHIKVQPQYISKMLSTFGLSLQTALPRESRMTDEEVVDSAINLLAEIRREGWKPENTFIMDETGAWSNVVSSKTYNPINSYEYFQFLKTRFSCTFQFSPP